MNAGVRLFRVHRFGRKFPRDDRLADFNVFNGGRPVGEEYGVTFRWLVFCLYRLGAC